VVGYRAPNFSIGPAQGWAYEVLLEEGFDYDSSLYPISHDRYASDAIPFILEGGFDRLDGLKDQEIWRGIERGPAIEEQRDSHRLPRRVRPALKRTPWRFAAASTHA